MRYNMNIGKKIAKTSFIYLLGQVFAKLITFFMLPLYTNYISTEVYGKFDLFLAYAAVIVPLIGIDVWGGMLRFILDEKEYESKRKTLDNGILILFNSLIILSSMYFIVISFFYIENYILVYIYLILWMVQNFYIYTSRGFNQNLVFAVSGIISAFSVGISSLICLFYFNLDIETLYISNIISFITQIIFIEFKLGIISRFSKQNISIEKIKKIYIYCIPNSIGSVFNWLLNSMNRIIITSTLGYAANGIFAISNKFISILSVFITVFMLSWQEAIFLIDDKLEQEKIYNNSFSMFIKAFGILICIITAGTYIIFPYFIGENFGDAYYLIPFFYIQFFASGLTWFMSSIVSSTKKTKIFLIEKAIISFINLSILLILIRYIGLYASPIAIFISEMIGIYIFKYFLRSIAEIKIKIPIKDLILVLLILGISSFIYIFGNKLENILWAICMGILGCLLFRSNISKVIKNNK